MGALFGLLAGIVGVVGYVPYARDIMSGTTRPDKMAWFIWLLEYGALFAMQLTKGATSSLWLIGLQLLGVMVVFLLSLRYGVGGITRYTLLLLAGIGVALFCWWLAGDATLAIILLLAVEASGVLLTIKKVYLYPTSETMLMWWLISAAGVLGLLAVGGGAQRVLYIYPIALIAMGMSVIGAAYAGGVSRLTHRCRCVWRAEGYRVPD